MKKNTLTFLFLVISTLGFSQNINLDQLLKIRIKSVGEVEEYLAQLNWKMDEAIQAKDTVMGYATFSYNPANKTILNSALITLFAGKSNLDNRIMLETANESLYKSWLTRLSALNIALKKSAILDKKIRKTYLGKDVVVVIQISSATNRVDSEYTFYTIVIYSTLGYLLDPNQ